MDYATIAIGLAAAFLLLRYKVNSTWLVLGGAAAGILIRITGLQEWLQIG